MALSEYDSPVGCTFGLEFDGITIKSITEVTGLKMEQDVIEYQQVSANGQPITKKMPGVKKAGETTVTRGMEQSAAFTEWIAASLRGDMGSARKNASIIYMDYQFNPVRRQHLRNAWCSKVMGAGATAGEASVMTETVTIVYEELVTE